MPSTEADPAPLWGLVLAGGRSTRMQQDKALLQLDGKTLVEHAYHLLDETLPEVFVSCRQSQWPEDTLPNLAKLYDLEDDLGPLGGLLSAISRQPAAAWLVLACDTPQLDQATLQTLIAHRDPDKQATAFRNPHDGKPEPLCTIYEPACRDLLQAQLTRGKQSLRDALQQCSSHLIELPNARVLNNINTQAAFQQLTQQA